MQPGCAALGHHLDGAARLAPDGRIVGVHHDAEFLYGIGGGHEAGLSARLEVRHSVELEIVGARVVAPAIHGDLRGCVVRPQVRGVVVLILLDHARRQRCEDGEHARTGRHLQNLVLRDHRAGCGRRGIDQRYFRRHREFGGGGTDFKLRIDLLVVRRLQHDALTFQSRILRRKS